MTLTHAHRCELRVITGETAYGTTSQPNDAANDRDIAAAVPLPVQKNPPMRSESTPCVWRPRNTNRTPNNAPNERRSRYG
jgi:hypothetical protein